MKELRNDYSANTYLRGEDLPKDTKPFFISMPLRRNLDSGRFQDAIREAFLDDYEKLVEINFDEETFLPQLGLFRVKSHLQKLLNEKYSHSLTPTLKALEDLCSKTQVELTNIEKQLKEHDIGVRKKKKKKKHNHRSDHDHLLAIAKQSFIVCSMFCW